MKNSDKYIFRQAEPEDGSEILEILEEVSFQGNISLIYTRRPDAYSSLISEGEKVDIVVCVDTEQNKIVGFAALAIRTLFVNEVTQKVGYLFSLKSRKAYRDRVIPFYKGFQLARELNPNVHCFITTILEENTAIQSMFQKKRTFMPFYQYAGDYHVFCLNAIKKKKSCNPYTFKPIDIHEIEVISEFINQNARQFQYFPYFDNKIFNNKSPEEIQFYGLYRNQELIACGALWNQQKYKQLVVNGYSGIYRWISPVSSCLKPFGIPKLSKPGSVINFTTLSFWGVKNNDLELFSAFLDQMAYEAGKFDLLTVGIHEKSPFLTVLKKRTRVVYKSKLYQVFWNNEINTEINQQLIPYLECGQL
jgi:hypothetical protein